MSIENQYDHSQEETSLNLLKGTEMSHSFTSSSQFSEAINDMKMGLLKWRIWWTLAWHGLHLRYKRTWIGMAWISLSFALFAIVKIVIFGPLSGKDIAFFGPYLAMGFLSYRLISNFIIGGSAIFVQSQNWIKSEPLPLSVHIFKLMATNLITFGFMLIPAMLICLTFGAINFTYIWTLPLAVAIFLINGVWVSVCIGIICTRYRDIMHFMTTIMQVMYFATPVLWVAPNTGIRAQIANANPFTHFIAIFREPILNGYIPISSLVFVSVCTIFGLIASLILFMINRQRLIFWL